MPKYIGPYYILKDFGNNSYLLDLPSDLKRCSIHNVFHSFLLCVHIPNDDHLFLKWLVSQVAKLDDKDIEWAIETIATHVGSGLKAVFEAI